jgi:hypothetical protein
MGGRVLDHHTRVPQNKELGISRVISVQQPTTSQDEETRHPCRRRIGRSHIRVLEFLGRV